MNGIPANIKALLDKKSHLFEAILWQDNIPYDDPSFAKRYASRQWPAAKGLILDGRARLLEGVNGHPHQRILDLCCGFGLLAIELAARGHSVVGIDVSPAAIAQARKQKAHQHIRTARFFQRDITRQKIHRTFDTILFLNSSIANYAPWALEQIIAIHSPCMSAEGAFIIELGTYRHSNSVLFFKEAKPLWYESPSYVKYEMIRFSTQRALLEKYTVFNEDRDLFGFFSATTKLYSLQEILSLMTRFGFHLDSRRDLSAAARKKSQMFVFRSNGPITSPAGA